MNYLLFYSILFDCSGVRLSETGMFIYFRRLYEKYRRRILQIAVFSYDATRDEPSEFNLGFSFSDVLRLQFYTVKLKKQNWRDYMKQDNPVAAA